MGIDGRIFPVSAVPKAGKKAGELDFMDHWYPIQVKQKDKAGRPDIDALEAVMTRENRTKGFFVSFDFSSDAMSEIGSPSPYPLPRCGGEGRVRGNTGKVIVALTVRDILDEELAVKVTSIRTRSLPKSSF